MMTLAQGQAWIRPARFNPDLRGPRSVPAIREQFSRLWDPNGVFGYSVRMADEVNGAHFGNDRVTPEEAIATATDTLRRAELWYIAGDMLDLVEAAASGVPADTLASECAPPSLTDTPGFAVLEKPWVSVAEDEIVSDARPFEITALSWSYAHLLGVPMLVVTTYGHTVMERTTLDLWAPIGRTEWMMPEPLEYDEQRDLLRPKVLVSVTEDRRFIAAFFALIHQQGLAHMQRVEPTRTVRRQQARAGYDDSTVKLVTLRRLTYTDSSDDSEARQYTHRWIVNGHWRNQPYGPGRTQRRLTYIAPHIKGPADAPLKEYEHTVNVFSR